jgi:aerobic C4-dicarboxylate transport protein
MMLLRSFRLLYVQVLAGIALGILVGYVWPETGVALKPLGDAFVRLIKMVIAPVIFCTVAAGIARMSDMKAFGRLGLRTLVYFEVVSTLALAVGLVVGRLVKPGAGFNVDPAALDPSIAAGYVEKASHGATLSESLLAVIPEAFFGAFAEGNLLQVLLIAILTGIACTRLGDFGRQAADVFDSVSHLFFGIIQLVVKFAPIGAFGAMGFTIGKFGIAALVKLGALVATFYATSLIFVLVVLGSIAALAGFSILKYLRYIREELLIVLGTSSSESVLPQMMQKLQQLGAGKTTTDM